VTEILSAVLRLSGLRVAQADLESQFDISVDRYDAVGAFAQLNVGDNWASIAKALEAYGGVIRQMKLEESLQMASLDVAFCFYDDMASMTRQIPHHILYSAGLNQIDIDVSVYLTSRD
jgi:hypothetical protein